MRKILIVTDINSKIKTTCSSDSPIGNSYESCWALREELKQMTRVREGEKLAIESALFNVYWRWKYTCTCIYMYRNVWVSIWMKIFKNGPKNPHSIQHHSTKYMHPFISFKMQTVYIRIHIHVQCTIEYLLRKFNIESPGIFKYHKK